MALSFSDLTASLTAWELALLPALSGVAPVNAAENQAFASVCAEVYAFLSATANQAFLSTATGDALTAKAADLGVSRPIGTPAGASLTVALIGQQPAGWQIDPTFTFSTAGDALNAPVTFVPTGITTITPTQTTATVPVQAAVVGTQTNVAAATIISLVGGSPYVLSVTNAAPASGGTDTMADAQLLTEAQATLAPPGTVLQIQKTAAGVAGIVSATVIDTQDGNGTVNVYAIDGSDLLSGATTTPAVPTTGEAKAILDAVLLVAAPGLTVQVALLTVHATNVTLTSVTQVPGSGLSSGVVVTAVETYLNSFLPGATFVPSQLINYLLNVAFPNQLLDVEPSSMAQVTTGTNPLSIGVIRAGTVTISSFT